MHESRSIGLTAMIILRLHSIDLSVSLSLFCLQRLIIFWDPLDFCSHNYVQTLIAKVNFFQK